MATSSPSSPDSQLESDDPNIVKSEKPQNPEESVPTTPASPDRIPNAVTWDSDHDHVLEVDSPEVHTAFKDRFSMFALLSLGFLCAQTALLFVLPTLAFACLLSAWLCVMLGFLFKDRFPPRFLTVALVCCLIVSLLWAVFFFFVSSDSVRQFSLSQSAFMYTQQAVLLDTADGQDSWNVNSLSQGFESTTQFLDVTTGAKFDVSLQDASSADLAASDFKVEVSSSRRQVCVILKQHPKFKVVSGSCS